MVFSQAGVTDVAVLVGAILHDTVEDTETSLEEVEAEFGPEVRGIVAEVSDNKDLEKMERKRLQIVHAPHKSPKVRNLDLLKINAYIMIYHFDLYGVCQSVQIQMFHKVDISNDCNI